MKYIAALTILFGGFFCFQTFTYADTPIQVVRKEVKYIENDNTVLYSKLWVRSMQNAVLFHHSDNIRNRDTLRNVTSSSLVKAKQLSFQKAKTLYTETIAIRIKNRERKHSSVLHCDSL